MKKTLLLLAAAAALCACGGEKEFSPADDAGMQLSTNVSIFESQGSHKKWILRAETVDFSSLQSAVLKNPDLLLKENGQDSASVTGKTGTFDYPTKLVTIEGNAKIQSFTENLIITAERFFYDVDKDRIWSEGKTVVTRGGAKVTAKGGIETDSKLTKIEIKKQTTQLPADAKELKTPAL